MKISSKTYICPLCHGTAVEHFKDKIPLDVSELLILFIGTLLFTAPLFAGQAVFLCHYIDLPTPCFLILAVESLITSLWFVHSLLTDWIQARNIRDGISPHYIRCPNCGFLRITEQTTPVPTPWGTRPKSIIENAYEDVD